MERTSRFRIPLLAAGQAQKELTHNEGLLVLDNIVHGCCNGPASNEPPISRIEGVAYLCGETPTGEWIGHANEVACWTVAGWRFIPPAEGMQFTDISDGCQRRYLNGEWSIGIVNALQVRVGGEKVVGSQCPPISAPQGGSVVDNQGRETLDQILSALRAHGLIAS